MSTQLRTAFSNVAKHLLVSSFVVAAGCWMAAPAAQAQVPAPLVRQSVSLPDEIVYYLDGQRVDKGILAEIAPGTIANLSILKGADVAKVLGNVSETRAVLITTKANENSAAVIDLNKKLNRIIDLSGKLLLIDGKEVTKAEFERLLPSQLQQITVLSSEKAVEAYGEKGKNGSAAITTK